MKTETERLQELLELKDAEIDRLAEELEKANDHREQKWEWCRHRDVEENPALPVPRLEMRWQKDFDDWSHCTAEYRLIYRHLLGNLVAIPLGQTNTQGSSELSPAETGHEGMIRIPFRDGVHIANDSVHLNLPAFVICEDRIDTITRKDGKIHQERFSPHP